MRPGNARPHCSTSLLSFPFPHAPTRMASRGTQHLRALVRTHSAAPTAQRNSSAELRRRKRRLASQRARRRLNLACRCPAEVQSSGRLHHGQRRSRQRQLSMEELRKENERLRQQVNQLSGGASAKAATNGQARMAKRSTPPPATVLFGWVGTVHSLYLLQLRRSLRLSPCIIQTLYVRVH